ncbi:cytochrome P450 [Jatrophihabitans sp.]|uniref:cytochrome P450 n=1 Tax=Jatrophihabitans sp. TaxID=1932789 RepID=UPI0030C6BDBD|nr:cypA [Jatrophihabitans sp.]
MTDVQNDVPADGLVELSLDELRARFRRDYDPFSSNTIAAQLAELADRRDEVPVSYSARGNGCWVITRYDDISSMLRRSNRGFISFPSTPDGVNTQGSQKAMIPIEIDGAEHRKYRQVLDPLFAPARVGELEPLLRRAANDLIDEFIEAGEVDFAEEFALPFPGATVLAIMGWPAADLHRLNSWVGIVMHGIIGASQAESDAARGAAHSEIRQYFLDLIAVRRESLSDDVTSHLINLELNGEHLTDDQLFDTFLLMMLAGLDTVKSVLAQSFVYLGQHPEAWDAMFATPESLDPAIEELLRFTSPAVPTRNVTDVSVTVGGVPIPKGERVHGPLAAANRDPSYYPEPDEIKFDRQAKPHLAFGLGPHRCLGVHLARLELRIGFEELRRRLPTFSLDTSRRPVEHLGLAWGVEGVHITFPPGKREGA